MLQSDIIFNTVFITMSVVTFVSLSLYFFRKAQRDRWDTTTDTIVMSGIVIALSSVVWPLIAVLILLTIPAKRIGQAIEKGKR